MRLKKACIRVCHIFRVFVPVFSDPWPHRSMLQGCLSGETCAFAFLGIFFFIFIVDWCKIWMWKENSFTHWEMLMLLLLSSSSSSSSPSSLTSWLLLSLIRKQVEIGCRKDNKNILEENLDPRQKCVNVFEMQYIIFGNGADLATGIRNINCRVVVGSQSRQIPRRVRVCILPWCPSFLDSLSQIHHWNMEVLFSLELIKATYN